MKGRGGERGARRRGRRRRLWSVAQGLVPRLRQRCGRPRVRCSRSIGLGRALGSCRPALGYVRCAGATVRTSPQMRATACSSDRPYLGRGRLLRRRDAAAPLEAPAVEAGPAGADRSGIARARPTRGLCPPASCGSGLSRGSQLGGVRGGDRRGGRQWPVAQGPRPAALTALRSASGPPDAPDHRPGAKSTGPVLRSSARCSRSSARCSRSTAPPIIAPCTDLGSLDHRSGAFDHRPGALDHRSGAFDHPVRCSRSSARCSRSSAPCSRSSARCSRSSAPCSRSSVRCSRSSAPCSRSSVRCPRSSVRCVDHRPGALDHRPGALDHRSGASIIGPALRSSVRCARSSAPARATDIFHRRWNVASAPHPAIRN